MPVDPSEGPASPSRYADKPYAVGKGKPPKAHQFKAGNTLGGRKRGSRNRTSFDKLLDERVQVGEDRLGRPIRKRWREIINLQLLKKAGNGDLAAIRIVKEFELKQAALARVSESASLSPAEIARAETERAEKEALAARLVQLIENTATAKRGDLPRMVYRDGKLVPLPGEEAAFAAPEHKVSVSDRSASP